MVVNFASHLCSYFNGIGIYIVDFLAIPYNKVQKTKQPRRVLKWEIIVSSFEGKTRDLLLEFAALPIILLYFVSEMSHLLWEITTDMKG